MRIIRIIFFNRKDFKTISLISITIIIVLSSCKSHYKLPKEYNRFENSTIKLTNHEQADSKVNYQINITGRSIMTLSRRDSLSQLTIKEVELSHKTTNKLFNKLECSNFFDFHNEYGDETGIPKKTLKFEHRGFKKEINIYSDAPEELVGLIEAIEAIANEER